ncbi:3-oxoacyl-ACP reductase [Rhodococcus sp. NPDC055112]|uniref:3-oxoacyl-ACP reductase n=1 Tax=Rhodococcus oryzae TaxID=2571143 RepID=A0ABY2RJF7_9NOCA|nr:MULTISPECIES: 3-oxoacyl-ACP reductase [Rhodococcus]MCZ4556489.1 3-oxoacyl-ACP reductase [Rhodococcus maanshanensis]TJZ76772.1 3-oxoacyl-ACP reductase [Rhodococcus oryzae]
MVSLTSREVSLDGKVAIVTGGASGLGKAEAIGLAKAGANVVINDLVANENADAVLDEIQTLGGKAVFIPGDIGERATADALMEAAQQAGGVDIVVNNAGIVRDKMLFSMSDEDWDLVLKVHLRGHFLLCRNAAVHWRAESKAAGAPVYGRLINTSSEAGLLGPAGQPNYGAAKAGITALTLSAARGLERYGVRANAICPRARTAMTENVFGDAPEDGTDPLSPEHVVNLVSYLASPAADAINGQVFIVYGPMVALMAAPVVEQRFDSPDAVWTPEGLADSLGGYFDGRDPARMFAATEAVKSLG